jgi:hypothetical protein
LSGNASKHVLNHSRRKKIIFLGLDSGGLEMHQNTFFTTPDVKKYFFKDLILVVQKCIKTRFSPLQTLKNIFFKDLILVVWKYAQMH